MSETILSGPVNIPNGLNVGIGDPVTSLTLHDDSFVINTNSISSGVILTSGGLEAGGYGLAVNDSDYCPQSTAGDIVFYAFPANNLHIACGEDPDSGITLNPDGGVNIAPTSGLALTIPKVGFFGATTIEQPTTASSSATFTANSGTAVNDASTFDGYTISQVVKALRDFGLLA